ncbi:MAG: regulatory protein RecX [Clostridia bacterium]|nr:regulatory protein RecX [Clostridia bacterium]
MKLTAKQGKKDKIHISVDGEYLLTVDSNYWFSCGYISGDEIDSEELTAFKEAAASRCAFNSAMFSLDRRDYSAAEMRRKLSPKYGEKAADEAVEKLCELNLINDERYAENFANSLYAYKKYGKNRIKSELYRKGIDSDIIKNVLDEIFESEDADNVQRIVEIIRKKYYNKMDSRESRQKVFAAMVRLGYAFSDIRDAMDCFSDDEYYEDF